MAAISLSEDLTERLYQIADQRRCSVEDVVTDLVDQWEFGTDAAASAVTEPQRGLRALIDSVNDVMFVLDADQRHVGVYGQWLANFGMGPDDFLGKTAVEIMGPDAAVPHVAANERALKGEHVAYEWTLERDGEIMYFQTVLSPIVEPDGTVSGIAGMGREITDLKRIQSALYDSEERYRLVLKAMAEGVVFHRMDGSIAACNEAAQRILGLSADQLTGRTSMDPRWHTIREDGTPYPGSEHPAMVTLQTGIPQRDVIMGVFKPSGELTWISINTYPVLREGNGKQPYGVVASFADVTASRSAQTALRESEERFRLIFELSHTGIVWSDKDGNFVQANPAFLAMVGYTHDELRQMNFRDLTLPEDLPRELPLLRQLDAGERDSYMLEKRLPTRSGEHRIAMVSISVSRNMDGSPRNYVGMIEDVTERKRIEQARFDFALKQERLKLLSDFVQSVAHEFRTPLSVINTNAYLMELAPNAERRSQSRGAIQEQVNSIAALVDSMILMAKLDGEEAAGLEEIDPHEVLRVVSSELHEALYRKQIQLVADIKSPLPRARGMVDHLITAIRKIIENAIRFSPFGGTVVVSVDTDGEHLVWSIQDFGPGIHEQALSRIFELFYREDQARTERGFGLGLPIAQRIIEQHQGQIEVESEPGRGSVFRVLLPAGHSEPRTSQTA